MLRGTVKVPVDLIGDKESFLKHVSAHDLVASLFDGNVPARVFAAPDGRVVNYVVAEKKKKKNNKN